MSEARLQNGVISKDHRSNLRSSRPKRKTLAASAALLLALPASVPASPPQAVRAMHPALRDAAPSAATSAPTAVTPAERHRVLSAVARHLAAHYFDRAAGRTLAAHLLAGERHGDYQAVTSGDDFAALLTRQLRQQSHDMHLEVEYSERPLPPQPGRPAAAAVPPGYRRYLEQNHCNFGPVQILPPNIGYLKLDSFPDLEVCRSIAAGAMASLDAADAVIFDLRDNRGGAGEMVRFLAGYLFNHPEYLFSPRERPSLDSFTQSPVPGSRLAGKPVYVLTSSTTISAAEQFCYDLKMLRRITLVGETTHGSAHAGVFFRLDDHYGMGIPEIQAINPFAKADWEGTGVEPDVKTSPNEALATARRLAATRLAAGPLSPP